MMPKKMIAVILIAVIVIALVGVVWAIQKQPRKYTGPVEKITVATGKSGVLIFIAEEQGFFSENGLDVEINDIMLVNLLRMHY